MKNRLIFWFSVFFLALSILGACFADRIAPYDPNREYRREALHPPTQLHFKDNAGQWSWIPFVYAYQRTISTDHQKTFQPIQGKKYFLRTTRSGFFNVTPPARLYLLGTDSRGRDIFSRMLYGARISLSVGILGALFAVALGFCVGAIAGYCGGWMDSLLMRFTEFFMMIPALYLLLALRAALPPTLGSLQVYLLIVFILSLVGWGGVARVIRGMVLSLREQGFILAAESLGRSAPEILIRHILPHTVSYLAVILSLSIPGYIFGESFLSILGLGIQEPEISWGNLLSDAMSYSVVRFHPWVLYPGLFIFLTAFACNVIGDYLRQKSLPENLLGAERS